MTFSIVAWDEVTGATGVAVASRFLAVGSLCPAVRGGAGALANQAYVNPAFGPRALALLELGVGAEDVLRMLLEEDEGREHRQLHVVDRRGNTAAFTGTAAMAWAGHKTFPFFSVAGNMLVSESTLDAMAATYRNHPHSPLPHRLVTALAAGQAAGGDKRGRQSAALYVAPADGLVSIDLRVDDHPNPVDELTRILVMGDTTYAPLVHYLAAHPSGLHDADVADAEMADRTDKTKSDE